MIWSTLAKRTGCGVSAVWLLDGVGYIAVAAG